MIGQTNEKILSNKLHRTLRKNMTDAEQALWKALRNRQFADCKFRRQHPFGDYILDFVCLPIKLVIEVDGGQHSSQTEYDKIRTERLLSSGFVTLRFWNNEVIQEIESVTEKIWLTVQEMQPHPHPNLPLEGEGTNSSQLALMPVEREGENRDQFCIPDITCLSCGLFRKELEALVSQGKIDFSVMFLDSMLHMKPARLEQEMKRVMEAGSSKRYLLLYGDCHPRMHEMQAGDTVAKVPGINCCEILLGRDAYRTMQKEKVFIFLPEWTLRWREVFTHELGFKKPETAQAFMKEHLRRLVYLDTGVMPVPETAIQEISEYFNMPVEVMPISLDILLEGLNLAMQKFMGETL